MITSDHTQTLQIDVIKFRVFIGFCAILSVKVGELNDSE